MLLELTPAPESNSGDRALFRITGGALAKSPQSGTFEIRSVKDDGTVLAIVHDFEPRLPWWIYRGTQALAHEHIMRGFGRALRDAGRG